MKELNCLGDMCPIPMMKLKNCSKLRPGEKIKLITDHSCVVESITEYCRKNKFSIETVEPMNGIWELYIERN